MRLLLFIILLCGVPNVVSACSCSEYLGTLKEKLTRNYERSDWVLIGNVISITDPNANQPKVSSGDAILYEFEVITILKGLEHRKTITITRPRYYDDFKLGSTYIVHGIFKSDQYAFMRGAISNFITGDCRRNKNVRNITKKERRIYRRLQRRS